MATSVSRHHHQLTADSAGYVSGIKAAEAASSRLAISQGKAASASQACSKAASRFGLVAQQSGYQVQDFAVQVAGGQSALVAFSQQGSQLLGIFGPGGAIAGASLAVGVLATRLLTMKTGAKEATEQTDKLYEALKRLEEFRSETRFAGLSPEAQAADLQKRIAENEKSAKEQMALAENFRKTLGQYTVGSDYGSLVATSGDPADLQRFLQRRVDLLAQGLKADPRAFGIEEFSSVGAATKRIAELMNAALTRATELTHERDKLTKDLLATEKGISEEAVKGANARLQADRKRHNNELIFQDRLSKDLSKIGADLFKDVNARQSESVNAALRNFFYDIDNPQSPIAMRTPLALRTNAGASALGGVAVEGQRVLDIQKSTLEVQKQILAEQKRLTSFWAGAN